MIEEQREDQIEKNQEGQAQEFGQEGWNKELNQPANWHHGPKRGEKSNKKEGKDKSVVEKEDKRKNKIEDKIFRKVVHQTDDVTEKAPTGPAQGFKVDRQVDHICNILKYMLCEHALEGKPEYINQDRTCQNWEVDEIMKQVSDTNLGDFIFKCPNPDNLPQDWIQKYEVEVNKETNESKSDMDQVGASQAMQFFFDLFEVQTYSRIQKEREHVAFLVAFYFLRFQANFQDAVNEMGDVMLKAYDYYKMVESKSLKEYMQMRQQQNFFQKHEYIIKDLFRQEYDHMGCFQQKSKWADKSIDDFQQMWKNLLKTIYVHLNEEFLSILGPYSQDKFQDQEPQCRYFYSKVKSISELLRAFPDVIERVLLKVKYFDANQEQLQKKKQSNDEKIQKDEEQIANNQANKQLVAQERKDQKNIELFDDGKRMLFWGQYLKKTIVGENVIWVNTKSRPHDVATLLRFSLLYKLVIKSKLFVRQFLSKDEKHIMLVIKTSQEILENYAQKYKITMEVDLGASDLFSFEPVDQYMRPLRLHKYVTDQQFLDKYHIKPTKADTSKKDQLQSIQSEALNIYKKVQLMNGDQLRTLVMGDQMQTNDLLKFLRRKLNIDFIEQHPLHNEHNKDTTERDLWQIYYVYNKIISAFIKRIKNMFMVNRKQTSYYAELQGNLGMLLRLMFMKALHMCNQMYYEHRQMRSIVPRALSNFCNTKEKQTMLKTIWHYINIDTPSGYYTYQRADKLQRLWRKFEVNQLKERSKFFPAERLMITNKVIIQIINLSSSLDKKHILDYYPLHDPYTLKNIEVAPYLSVIKKLRKQPRNQSDSLDAASISRLYSLYECKYTISDFTKMSVEKQLQFKCTQFKTFQTGSIRAYCGEKIAFYFTLIKFLAIKAWPLVIPAFILQILLWAQNSQVLATGVSGLTQFNDALISIWCVVNLIWTTDLIQTWKQNQRTLAQQYGVTKIQDNQERRVKFEGRFKRDFQTDQLNFQYVPKWQTILKTIFTVLLNISYVVLVTEVVLMLFLLKTYLYQLGQPQIIVQQVPSILIAIVTQIFTKIYTIIIKNITDFENHKTVTQYESSLVSKSALISFVINFYSIFIYAYFSGYLGSSFICQIRTTQTNVRIDNCSYFVSSQLLSLIMVDFITTIIGAWIPFIMFKYGEWSDKNNTTKTSKFNFSFFQSIDNFYEEQDKMDTYMYTEELDSSWVGYMNIVNVFAATALFAPAFPLAYTMMFLTGIVRLHASKFEVIFFKKRILPTKTNSINWWLIILEIISMISILTNVAYLVYTRKVFAANQAKLFFMFIILFFAIKYFMLAQYTSGTDIMSKRNEIKTSDLLKNRRRDQFENIPQELNTDIENVIYDENRLNRKFHDVSGPNVKNKDKKKDKEKAE